MRAAVSYHYAQNKDRGTEKWHNDGKGNYSGNPALSHTVSRYMISLQKRKVQEIYCIFVIYESLRKLRVFISQTYMLILCID